jgi:hypothetical protein
MGVNGDIGDWMRDGATCAESHAKSERDVKLAHREWMVGVATSVQYLHRNFTVFRMNSTGDNAVLLDLVSKTELRG